MEKFTKEQEERVDMKIVKVKIKYPYQFEEIVEEVDINVPIGLSEEEEDKFIDDVIERDYAYLYGR